MRSFITFVAFAAAATAATSPLVAREDAQACAMKTLLSSSACNTGDAACLCSDSARKSVMEEIKAACGAEQSEATDNLATEACRMQKVRRATMPSATAPEASGSSSSASERVNGAQDSSDGEGCTCANTGASKSTSNSPAAADNEAQGEDSETDTDTDASPSSHGSNSPSGSSTDTDNEAHSLAQSSRVHGAGVMATPATAAAGASSSAARHGALATPTSSFPAIPTPSGADPFAQFQGAGAQVVPSMTVVGGVLAGIVGAFVAL
ncbi:hypothetical protein UA08_04027 [Talaromyces atroroseus]|uniref:CFEM domain-containing protein n=1 Tax=Talaromyces atroroseus TaxID=1441469 RepID=A0A1Q5Q9G8_TALAT|nr:hypothetical protein UA08_04027 [Talaromyces atroroseus]OKL60669.1 hypothetical protein UA08_04027 [Talaromyces atroroseus]